MGNRNIIADLLEDELELTEYFLVDVKANESETDIRFYIDGPTGVGIDACAKISRRVSAQFDELELDTDRFRYEISSPGADSPLLDRRQYKQHIGRELAITLQDNSTIEGELTQVDEEGLKLKVLLDKKKKTTETRELSFDNIIYSKVKISFKRVKK